MHLKDRSVPPRCGSFFDGIRHGWHFVPSHIVVPTRTSRTTDHDCVGALSQVHRRSSSKGVLCSRSFEPGHHHVKGSARCSEHYDPVLVLNPSVGTCFFPVLLVIAMGLCSIALAASRTQAFNVSLLFVPTLVLVQRQPQRWTGPCNPLLCRVRGGQCHISSRVIPTIAGTNTNHFRNVGLATTARCHRQGDKLVETMAIPSA